MPYANETTRYKIPWWAAGEISSGASNEDAALNIEWPLELLNKVLAGDDCDCTLGSGFEISIGAGLSIDVAAGSGMIGGLVIYAGDVTNKGSLPDDTATIYVYLKLTATTKRDRTFTVEVSLSGPPMADAIYIGTCTTDSGAVTAVDNAPAERTPRLPGALSDIPGLRVVAPAGAEYTDPKAAIEACSAGDVVYICAGTYTLTATITVPANNITILGANRGAVILDNTTGSGQTVLDLNGKDGIRLGGFTIQTAAGNTGYGISASGCDDLLIEGVYINSAELERCISCTSGARITISNCRVVHPPASAGAPITITESSDVMILHNRITCSNAAAQRAIWVSNSQPVTVRGNRIQMPTPHTTTGTAKAIYLYVSSGAVATPVGAIIHGNTVYMGNDDGDGIHLACGSGTYYLDESLIADNIIIDAERGIRLNDSRVRETLVHGNKAATCGTGVSDAGTNTNALDQD